MPAWTKRLAHRPWIAPLVILLLGAGLMFAGGERMIPTSALPPSMVQVPFPRFLSGGQARPNILLITVDTLRADALGAYGNPFLEPSDLHVLRASARDIIVRSLGAPGQ